MTFAVYYNEKYWWDTTKDLKDKCEEFDRLCQLYEDTDGEEGLDESDYQSDSPYAEYITGYNTDSYADTLSELIESIWEKYTEECEDEERTPTWDDCWDNYIWEDFDYQLCHTWLRVTNIHNDSDESIKEFAKESDFNTMSETLGLDKGA